MTTPPASQTQASLYQTLRSHLILLKLDACAEALPGLLDQAAVEKLSVTATIERLVKIEVDTGHARRLAGRLRFACLPTPATLDSFDFEAQPAIDRSLINELGTGRYLETATNVLLIGPPGVGKTHLAVGLARQAATVGYRVYFTTAADLAARCHRAAIGGRWANTMRFFNGPTLLIIDELGYLPLPAEAASALFQVVSQRYLKTSILLTTNRGVGGAKFSVTPPSPQRCSTGCCTARSSSTSTATAIGYALTTPATTPSAGPSPATEPLTHINNCKDIDTPMDTLRPARRNHWLTPAIGTDSDQVLDTAIENLAVHRNFPAFADIGTTMHLVASLAQQTEQRLNQLVADARNENYSWAEIGDLLGITRSSAWQRHAHQLHSTHPTSEEIR